MNMFGNASVKHLLVLCSVVGLAGCSLETDAPTETEKTISYQDSSTALTKEPDLPAEPAEKLKSPLGDGLEVDAKSTQLSTNDSFKIISEAGHDCGKVVTTVVKSDLTIATCDNGESYRVFLMTKPKQMPIAIKCSAMVELGIEGGC